MKTLSECRLYAFVDTAYLHGRAPALIAQQLCDGGADLIQLRAKHSTEQEILEMARAILPVTRRSGVRLVINDHLRVAQEVEAALCHLGQEDFFDAGHHHVSELAGTGHQVEIGLSTHAPEQAVRAVAAGAAYVAIGPVYATGTKPGVKPVTLEYVRWAVTNVQIPWFAIGGINLGNIDDVLAAGAKRICVVSRILNASDVAEECRKYRERLP
jgi:thiamine-phosphate pyrophosphorylase